MSENTLIRLIISGIGSTLSVVAVLVLGFVYGNHHAGIQASFSAVLSGFCFHIFWLKHKNKLARYHTKSTIGDLFLLGICGTVVGIGAMIWYLFRTFNYHIPIQPISDSTILAAIWSMLSAKWGIVLTYHSHKYKLTIELDEIPDSVEDGS